MAGHGVVFVYVMPDYDPENWLPDAGATFPAIKDDAVFSIHDLYEVDLWPTNFVIGRDMVIRGIPYVSTEAVLEGSIMDAAYIREPLDIAMVMDVSDSMNSPSPSDPGGDTKLTIMKQAATMITDFLYDHGQFDDHMGLVWFTDDVSEYRDPFSNEKLLSVQTKWNDLRTQIGAQGTGLCTAMGPGLQTAFDTLSTGARDRFAILCTDGMQNIEPKVTEVSGHYEIIDSGGWLCGGHSSVSAHGGEDIADYNTPVHPIGIGITATYESLLQDVANATGGFYRATDDPDMDLDLIYFLDLCNCMAGASPAVAHHHAGRFYPGRGHAVERFSLNASVRKVTAMLSWKQAQACNLIFWLRAPDGRLLDLHREMRLFEDHCLATFYLPEGRDAKETSHAGQWSMIVSGEAEGNYADYHAFVIVEDREVKCKIGYPKPPYGLGKPLPVNVALTEFEEPILAVDEIFVETAHQSVALATLLAEYPDPNVEKLGIKEAPKDPNQRKLVAMTVDPGFRERLRPVRRRFSLSAKQIEWDPKRNRMRIPMVLHQSGLNSFKLTVRCQTPRSGPISRVDLVSVFVKP